MVLAASPLVHGLPRGSTRQPALPPLSADATSYAVTVDVEEEWPWSAGWPKEPASVTNVQSLLAFHDECARHAASVTYFVNHAVMDDPEARSVILELSRRPNTEIGMHIHPWNTPPHQTDLETSERGSFLHNLTPELIRAKLATVYRQFTQWGLEPVSFRGGRYSSGGEIHRFLADHGFVADASVVPFTSWPDDGAPDYRRRGLSPCRVAVDGRNDRALWEIPVTSGFTRMPLDFWGRAFDLIQSSPLRHLRLIGIADRLNLVRRVWLNFEDPMGRHMEQLLGLLLKRHIPCVCFTLHSSSLMVGANGCYTRDRSELEDLFARLRSALGMLKDHPQARAATVREIAHELEARHHARPRN